MPTLTVAAPALRALLEGASVAAATDKLLPAINSVLLEWTPEALTAVATDRYRLCVGTLPASPAAFSAESNGEALLALEDVRELIRALPKARRGFPDTPVTVDVVNDYVTFTGAGWSRKVETVDAQFVKYRAIVWDPKDATPVARIGFNPVYMASVSKVPTEKNAPWAWHFLTPLKPAIATSALEVSGAEIGWRFLIMPVRLPNQPAVEDAESAA